MAAKEQDGPSLPLPLEILLSFPFFWKPSKICNFVKATLPKVRGVQESAEVGAFKTNIDQDARQLVNTLWPGESWKQVLEEIECTIWEECPEPPAKKKNKSEPNSDEFVPYSKQTNHFDILTKKYNKKNADSGICRYEKKEDRFSDDDFSSVIRLLKLIRDKMDHSSDIPPGRHEALGWFRNGKLDQNLCIGYWTRHFPRLFPFLWWKFHQFPEKGDSFKDFFQSSDNSDLLELYQRTMPIGLTEFLHPLRDALLVDLKLGGADMRFSNGESAEDLSLEFRTLDVDMLQRMLQGSTTLKIKFSSTTFSCVWSGTGDLDMEKADSVISNFDCENNYDTLTIVIGNAIDHVKKQLLRERYDDATGKVIVFTGRSETGADDKMWAAMEDIAGCIFHSSNVNEFKRSIQLSDVIELTSENIEELVKGWSVKFLGEDVTMSALVPMNEYDEAKSILSNLEGSLLNQILKGKTPKLFKSHSLPSNSEIYLPRWLSKRLEVTYNFMKDSDSSDIFVFVDTNELNLKYFLGDEIDITISEDASALPKLIASGNKLLFLKGDIRKLYELINSGSDFGKDKRVRVVKARYFYATCISTHCFNSAGDLQCTHDISCESRTSGEEEFVEFMAREETKEKFIVIGDKPGMGKSQALIRIANKLAALKTNFVIFLESNQFEEMLGTDDVRHDVVRDCIVDSVCENEFEKSLLTHWISEVNDSTPKVELLCDGLDEIKPEFRDRIFDAFQIIQNRFPHVRVWATVRDHMLAGIQEKLDCHGYKLEPFAKEDQIRFLKDHWLEYWRKCLLRGEEKIGSEPRFEDLEVLARKCTELPISGGDKVDIAGIPLQCRMMAEIHERRVVTGNFKLEGNKQYSLAELYDKMVERKLEVFLKEKVKLHNLSMSHHIANRERDHMDRAHVYFALKLIFSESVADRFKAKLIPTTIDWAELEITVKDQGLIQTLEPLMFVHRTFAEYILARFMYRVLTNRYVNIDRNDDDFQDLLWNYVLATQGDVGKQVFKFPVLCQLVDAICHQSDTSYYSSFWSPLHDIVFKLVETNNKEEYGIELDAPNFNCKIDIMEASKRGRKGRSLLGLVFATCYSKDFLDLFVEGLRLKLFSFCNFMVTYNSHFMSQNWHILKESNASQYGILHLCILDIPEYFQRLYNIIAVKSYKVKFEVGDNVRSIKDIVFDLLEKDRHILHDRDAEGRTPLLSLFSQQPIFHTSNVKPGIHTSVGDTPSLGPEYCKLDAKHYTHCAEKIYHELLPLFAEYGADFNTKDFRGKNALHLAIENGFSDDVIDSLIRNGCNDFRFRLV